MGFNLGFKGLIRNHRHTCYFFVSILHSDAELCSSIVGLYCVLVGLYSFCTLNTEVENKFTLAYVNYRQISLMEVIVADFELTKYLKIICNEICVPFWLSINVTYCIEQVTIWFILPISKVRVCKSVHYHTFKWINEPDAAISRVYYLSFKYSSTCFGHLHAHHQELQQLQ